MSKNSSFIQKGVLPRLRLRTARETMGWSQEDLGSRLGARQVTVSRWETGETVPSPYFRTKLCQLFGKTPEELDLGRGDQLAAEPTVGAVSGTYDPLIPPILRALVGRERELIHLSGLLCSADPEAVVALHGLPGVGKTTMAVALAHTSAIREQFPDGILWASLGTACNASSQLRRWASLMGGRGMQSAKSLDALALLVREAIGTRRMLLVLDDAWSVEDVLPFLIGGRNCVHLVTTRFPNVATEIDRAGPVVLRELDIERSLDLLHILAPQVVQYGSHLACVLAEAVGGLPLALSLCGNYLRLHAYGGQTRRIQTALEQLMHAEHRLHLRLASRPAERHASLPAEQAPSLDAVIALSDQHLKNEAREALYALSVLPSKPHTFSEAAALAVCACSTDALDELIDTGLLESSSESRYTLHQTIADYARVHLQGIEPHERLILYTHDVVESHRTDYDVLDQERETILAALEAAYELEKKEELVRNVCDLVPYLVVRSNYSLAEQHIQRACEAAVALEDDRATITTLLYRGQIAHKRGNYVEAQATFQEALAIARQSQNADSISAILRHLGWISWKLGSNAQAETYLKEGLLLARQSGDLERISDVLQTLGSVVGYRSDYIQETTYLHEALALARAIGDRARICETLIHLGISYSAQGNNHQAEISFQEGLTLARAIGHREWISALLTNLGDLVIEMGNYSQAEEYLQEGLTLARQIGNREWICVLLTNLGITRRKRGDSAQAEVYLQKALALAGQLGIPLMQSNTLYECGNLYLDQQKREAAATAFCEMLQITPQDCQELLALAQYGLARVCAAQGNLEQARQLGKTNLTVLEKIGHRKVQEVRSWLDDMQHVG